MPYLPEVAGHFDIVPWIVIELSIDWLHDGFKGSRAQIDNEGHGAVLQCQVDVVSWLAGVKDEAIALPRLEGESNLIAAALDGILGEIVAEVLRATESGHILFSGCGKKSKEESTDLNKASALKLFEHCLFIHYHSKV